jgi:3D (Asp-Asp-Asp) domain-containing protein
MFLTGQNILVLLTITVYLFGLLMTFEPIKKAQANFRIDGVQGEPTELIEGLVLVQNNTLLPISNPNDPESKVIRKIRVLTTAYSSTPNQTDSTPFITASGEQVKKGIVANNFLPFGTKIRIPELYGDKVFMVEDRMHWSKGNYCVDIWFSSTGEALNFGAKSTYIEVLGS